MLLPLLLLLLLRVPSPGRCGHCQALKSAWIELARSLEGKIRVAAVDCTANDQTCKEFAVRGFPSIKLFGENRERPEDYNGGRSLGDLSAFALDRWARMQPPPEVGGAAAAVPAPVAAAASLVLPLLLCWWVQCGCRRRCHE